MKYSLICGEQMNGQTRFLRAKNGGIQRELEWSSGRIFNYRVCRHTFFSAPNSNATSVDQLNNIILHSQKLRGCMNNLIVRTCALSGLRTIMN